MSSYPSPTEPDLSPTEMLGQQLFEPDHDADDDVSDSFVLFSFGPASSARVTTDA